MEKNNEKYLLKAKKKAIENINDSDSFIVIANGGVSVNCSNMELVEMLSGLSDALRSIGKTQEEIKMIFDIASDDEKEAHKRFKKNATELIDKLKEMVGKYNE